MTIEPPVAPSAIQNITEAFGRSVLAAVPFAGGALVEVFNGVASAGRERRMREFFEQVAEAVNRLILEPRGITVEALATDDGFLNVVGVAVRASAETSDKIKLDALRHAVLNSTFAPDIESDRRAIFVDILIGLTPTHIALVNLFHDPMTWLVEHERFPAGNAGLSVSLSVSQMATRDLICLALPDLAADPDLVNFLLQDLELRQLTKPVRILDVSGGDSVTCTQLSSLGSSFFHFVTAREATES